MPVVVEEKEEYKSHNKKLNSQNGPIPDMYTVTTVSTGTHYNTLILYTTPQWLLFCSGNFAGVFTFDILGLNVHCNHRVGRLYK